MTRVGRILAVAVMLLGAGVARAQPGVSVEQRPSAARVLLRDAAIGLALGSAVSGAIILYEMGIDDNGDYEWEEALAWGAGAGLVAGLVWGFVDTTWDASTYGRIAAPVRDGQSMTLDLRRRDQSQRVSVPLLRGRF
jgi:hypothetical protein